jgi:hypothetical protein
LTKTPEDAKISYVHRLNRINIATVVLLTKAF